MSEYIISDIESLSSNNQSECNVSDIYIEGEHSEKSVIDIENNVISDIVVYETEFHQGLVVTKMHYNVYFCILVATVVSGLLTIIVITLVVFFTIYIMNNVHDKNITISATNNTHSLLPNSTFINHTHISGYYTTKSTDSIRTIIQFKGNGFIQFVETMTCSVLLVGGGGGVGWGGGGLTGGSGTGGGGGGGVGEGTLTFQGGETYSIVVGIGGIAGHNYGGNSGGDTIIKGKGISEYAHGGGMGGYYIYSSHSGGSSGGNYGFSGFLMYDPTKYVFFFNNTIPGKATRGNGTLNYYGNPGGYGMNNTILNPGSGGGGAGSAGQKAVISSGSPCHGGDGGDGYLWSLVEDILPSEQQYYGAGGGGGGRNSCIGGKGGKGGGGNGGSSSIRASSPVPNSGGGGGGGTTAGNGFGTSGASGTVMIVLEH